MKDKSEQQDKDTKEGSNLQVAGPSGEITAGIVPKESCRAQVTSMEIHFSNVMLVHTKVPLTINKSHYLIFRLTNWLHPCFLY
jgi:hypothetical protein